MATGYRVAEEPGLVGHRELPEAAWSMIQLSVLGNLQYVRGRLRRRIRSSIGPLNGNSGTPPPGQTVY